MKKIIFMFGISFLIGITVFASAKTVETLTATVVDFKIFVDSEYKRFDLPVVVINDRTYIPLREVAEKLEMDVEWNDEDQVISFLRCQIRID